MIFQALAFALTPAKMTEDSMFRGGPSHPGVSGSPAPRKITGVKWTFPTGDSIFGSPVSWHGAIYFGSSDGNLYSVDAQTGVQRWKAPTGAAVNSTPAVWNGKLYATSYDGRLYCLDADTGALQWKYFTNGERRFEAKGLHGMQPLRQTFADPMDMFLSSPSVSNGAVYFGSGDGNVYAVDAETGDLRWKFKTGDVVHASPAVAGGRVFVGSWDSFFYALDASTGKVVWKYQGGTDDFIHNQVGFQSSPSVTGNTVYVGCRDSNLYAFDAATGKPLWKSNNSGSWVNASPACAGETLYYATCDSKRFRAVIAKTGKDVFNVESKGLMMSSPVVAGDVIVYGTFNGFVEGRDAKSGEPLWNFRTKGSEANRGWVLKADGTFNSGLLGSKPFTPATFERQFTAGGVVSTPLVVEGTVFFGSLDGYLYAIG